MAGELSYEELIPLSVRQEVALGGAWYRIRQERNEKLLKCDWTQVTDNHLTHEKRDEWITYRQALRDITTTQTINIDDECRVSSITWPTEPEP